MAESQPSSAAEVAEPQIPQSVNVLSDDELLAILRRQLHGRNSRYSSPAFKQKLAEEVLVKRLGDFKVGDRMFIDYCEEELKPECICDVNDPSLCTELGFPRVERGCACQELGKLIIQGVHLSGSKREGNDVRLNGYDDWSDVDVMIRLGPIKMLGEIAPASSQPDPETREEQRQGMSESADLPDDVPVVRLETTDQPGFVVLRHKPHPGCKHGEWLPLSARRVKMIIRAIGNLGAKKPRTNDRFCNLMGGHGPALTSRDEETNTDLVPCISLPLWPSEEYRSRHRPALQPPNELVERLCRTPAMLVAVGFEGSFLQDDQWRLSFSRHEHILLSSLTELQRDCLSLLKYCCALLFGPHGDVKGAYLKTALLWVCEEAGPDQWETEGLKAMARRVLSHLQNRLRQAHLPCYFWPEINMVATRTEDELSRIVSALQHLKAHLLTFTTALVGIFLNYDDSGVSDSRLPSQILYSDVQQKADLVCLGGGVELQETWLTWKNFRRLRHSRSSKMTQVYERVLASMAGSDSHGTTCGGKVLEDDWLTEE